MPTLLRRYVDSLLDAPFDGPPISDRADYSLWQRYWRSLTGITSLAYTIHRSVTGGYRIPQPRPARGAPASLARSRFSPAFVVVIAIVGGLLVAIYPLILRNPSTSGHASVAETASPSSAAPPGQQISGVERCSSRSRTTQVECPCSLAQAAQQASA
jgi:hypothetical protein